jgi:hypothetical protein
MKRREPSASTQIGRVRLEFDTGSKRLVDAMVVLSETYSAPPVLPLPLITARVVLSSGAPAVSGHDVAMPDFVFDAVASCYSANNSVAELVLTITPGLISLVGDVRVGRTTGPLFPKFLLRLATSVAVIQADSLLVHGCAMVSPEGKAVLFVGASGDGKTTMTRRLPGWSALADDTVLLEPSDDSGDMMVRGTPFAGSENLPRVGAAYPLHRMVVLDPHADELSLVALSTADGFSGLMQRAFCPFANGPIPPRIATLVSRIMETVPASRLSSNLSHDLTPLGDALLVS